MGQRQYPQAYISARLRREAGGVLVGAVARHSPGAFADHDRDLDLHQRRHDPRLGASCAVGPWIVPTDELQPFTDLHLTTRVNGELRQHDTTANLVFPFDYLIAYLSTFTELAPGDLIATGTPTGAGARFDPPRHLAPGDTVDVEIEGVGCLRNPA